MSNIPAARLAALEAVAEAARTVLRERLGTDAAAWEVACARLADALATLDAHTEAPLPHPSWETFRENDPETAMIYETQAGCHIAALSAAGWVVATLPTPADQWDSPGYDRDTPANIVWADGYNAALATIRASAVEVADE